MIEIDSLEQTERNFLNGKIAQYMDAYIRQHKVWTPTQMQSDFIEKIVYELENDYLPEPALIKYNTPEKEKFTKKRVKTVEWLLTDCGKEFSLNRFKKKYLKHKPIADRKSPLVERVRFGLKWDEKKYYDINFGLKDKHRFRETIELENIKYLLWTVEHVNTELKQKYNCNIVDCFEQLSNSFLEKKFIGFWRKNFYSNKNPCIIPEVCGFRSSFYYSIYNKNIYSERSEIKEHITSSIKPGNFRYDFLLANFKKQKIAFIELDGFEHHKTRQQQTIDSIKRNNTSKNDVSLFTFTSKRINEDIESVFSELESLLI